MKKFAASLLLAGFLAVAGFAAPANVASGQDTTISAASKKQVTTTGNIGWWP